MNRKTGLKATLILLAIFFLLSACDGSSNNGVSEGYGGVDLAIQGSLPAGTLAGRDAADSAVLSITDVAGAEIGQLTLTDARVNIYQIELEQELAEVDSEDEEAQELEVEYTGPFIVNVLTDVIEPAIPYIELLPGTYDEIKLKVARIEGDEVDDEGNPLVDPSDPLYENSIVLIGTYTGPTSTVNVTDMDFTATFAIDEEFVLGGTEVIILDEGVINSIIVAYRLARWFHFDNAETNGDSVEFATIVSAAGEIILNEDQTGVNATIWEVIKKNIKESADFGEDSDEDGELDSDEDEDEDVDSEDDEDF
ncbi:MULTISPECIES: hypothetical protein [unclassified Oceanispirochaeta]|uniref:hypothetical protein n=1 Tax=unclassified Oceanispirochaeta TaxID=2635722 RepID=UPI000E099D60|nr:MULTISPECIES: hypothetical protein [unclassified Oceanispirochaeta]MBF9015426.1 hypothetical protein [Oceanispirochaeta sp. M2]NPD71885.1 hypothetical protein [Oceanispirochaeta sp. M1]RDG32693.1 hypothetical protein DV872_07220 [Oceanispirochaeta sp. M1]